VAYEGYYLTVSMLGYSAVVGHLGLELVPYEIGVHLGSPVTNGLANTVVNREPDCAGID